jgi:hypothetical protein
MLGVEALGPIPAELSGWRELLAVSTARGALRILRGTAPRLVTQVVGYFSRELAHESYALTLREIADSPPLGIFAEWSRMTGYAAASHRLLTGLVLAHRTRFTEVYVYTQSTVVAIGVNTAGVATALVGVPCRTTNDRERFMARVLEP